MEERTEGGEITNNCLQSVSDHANLLQNFINNFSETNSSEVSSTLLFYFCYLHIHF